MASDELYPSYVDRLAAIRQMEIEYKKKRTPYKDHPKDKERTYTPPSPEDYLSSGKKRYLEGLHYIEPGESGRRQ